MTQPLLQTVLHFDCGSGLAGDMIVGALVDLGVPVSVIEAAVGELPLDGYRIRFEPTERSGLAATRFVVEVDETHQPHRHFGEIVELIASSGLSSEVKTLSIAIFERIGKAEAAVHGVPLDNVHFHEVGAVDSIVDIVGAAAALCHLDAYVTCAPIPLGHGTVKCAHGILPVPAPATLRLVEGLPVLDGGVACELTTPTGAAIVAVVAQEFCQLPAMVVRRVGMGAGTRVLPDRPNVLRVVLGERQTQARSTSRCVVIEANIDDMTGEVAAVAMQALLQAGALDVWYESIQMKKGRPALKLGLLCDRQNLESLAEVLFDQTSTIGLRYHEVGRLEMQRELRTVETVYGEVKVKLCRGAGGSLNAAPELEDCRRLAQELGVPVKRVLAVAAGEAERLLRG